MFKTQTPGTESQNGAKRGTAAKWSSTEEQGVYRPNGATDCSVAKLSVTFSDTSLLALTDSTDVICYFGNINQNTSGVSVPFRGPLEHHSARLIKL